MLRARKLAQRGICVISVLLYCGVGGTSAAAEAVAAMAARAAELRVTAGGRENACGRSVRVVVDGEQALQAALTAAAPPPRGPGPSAVGGDGLDAHAGRARVVAALSGDDMVMLVWEARRDGETCSRVVAGRVLRVHDALEPGDLEHRRGAVARERQDEGAREEAEAGSEVSPCHRTAA